MYPKPELRLNHYTTEVISLLKRYEATPYSQVIPLNMLKVMIKQIYTK